MIRAGGAPFWSSRKRTQRSQKRYWNAAKPSEVAGSEPAPAGFWYQTANGFVGESPLRVACCWPTATPHRAMWRAIHGFALRAGMWAATPGCPYGLYSVVGCAVVWWGRCSQFTILNSSFPIPNVPHSQFTTKPKISTRERLRAIQSPGSRQSLPSTALSFSAVRLVRTPSTAPPISKSNSVYNDS